MQQGYQKTGIPLTRLLVMPLGCFLIILCLSSATAQTLMINEKNGNKNAFSIEDISKISFSGGNIHVSRFIGNDFSFPLTGISHLAFSEESIINNELHQVKIGHQQLIVFPNPANELLNVSVIPSFASFSRIVIQAIDGKVIISQKVSTQKDFIQIDVSTLPSGLYLCHYNNGREVLMQKFIKK